MGKEDLSRRRQDRLDGLLHIQLRHLDPDLFIDRSLKGSVGGKVVLITGGSSGIGLAAACKFAEAGAITIICARGEDKLKEAVAEIHARLMAARFASIGSPIKPAVRAQLAGEPGAAAAGAVAAALNR
jgi:NAD(P)-dependent dehydrogenase (short-subunit alcohol dehydrogenase family)